MFTKDNILNLMITRGGTHIYKITYVGSWEGGVVGNSGKGRINYIPTERMLAHLNSGKWQVVTESEAKAVKLYEIY